MRKPQRITPARWVRGWVRGSSPSLKNTLTVWCHPWDTPLIFFFKCVSVDGPPVWNRKWNPRGVYTNVEHGSHKQTRWAAAVVYDTTVKQLIWNKCHARLIFGHSVCTTRRPDNDLFGLRAELAKCFFFCFSKKNRLKKGKGEKKSVSTMSLEILKINKSQKFR